LTEAADRESEKIVARAQREADEVRRGADEYAASVLLGLETEVGRTLQSIKKGIVLLDDRRADLRKDGAEQDGHDGSRNGNRNGNAPAPDEVEGASQPARL